MSLIKLAIFDIAGTTIKDNHEVSKALQVALVKHGYAVDLAQINPLMGYEKNLPIGQLLQMQGLAAETISTQLINAIHADFVQQMLNFYTSGPVIEPLPQVEETLKALREQGVKVGINTGFSKDIADAIINRLKWREKGIIDYLIGSDEVELGRPHPFMIQQLMQQAGITDPLQVLKAGDTEVDIHEGQNAGCRYVVGITTGIFTREELASYHPTHLIDDIAEVLTIING
ncbi:phosphonoacetaldehyde hydrolase [Pedobacter cryoconitis]|uniref:Phosphonoacetaldehyde hydrolase n=1 Tax=Pedobacter cryoconitis TaxID=188932 RepID=A0A127VJX5_9SPHI|nr:HAD-IA family hydrolase [Pedobacter cryoconitis]AMQ01568.1 phosphonoacetaldehyde hydrolase [Pedobacter cryoconitis]